MNREEHLQWAKDRALEYTDKGKLNDAFTSFQSDMSKHDELRSHIALELFTLQWFGGFLKSPITMRRFIEDFN